MNRPAFCIYVNTVCEGLVPAVRDQKGLPCIFATRTEAEREVADNIITRLQEFIGGERDFDDAMTVEEFIVEVDVLPDGSVVDADDNHFGAKN
jgi:hypothetical protein